MAKKTLPNISILAEKTTLADNDLFIIEDSADSNKKKKVKKSNLGGASIPSGVIMAFGGDTAPTGWLLCDGSAVSEATYAALFAIIAYTYGNPGGGNFNLPNLKGKIPVGKNAAETEFDTLGETGGAKTHTLITDEMPAHTHKVNKAGEAGSQCLGNAYRVADGTPDQYPSNSAGGGGAHNNLQPYIVLNYIIKT